MTPDQKLLNTIYMREVRRLWKEAGAALDEQINAAKAAGGRVVTPVFVEGGGGVDLGFGKEESKGGDDDAGADAKSDKSEAGGGDAKGSGGAASAPASAPAKTADATKQPMDEGKMQIKILTAISIKRMREWLEEDDDRAAAAVAQQRREQRNEAKKEHENFVAKLKSEEEVRHRRERREKKEADALASEKDAASKANVPLPDVEKLKKVAKTLEKRGETTD